MDGDEQHDQLEQHEQYETIVEPHHDSHAVAADEDTHEAEAHSHGHNSETEAEASATARVETNIEPNEDFHVHVAATHEAEEPDVLPEQQVPAFETAVAAVAEEAAVEAEVEAQPVDNSAEVNDHLHVEDLHVEAVAVGEVTAPDHEEHQHQQETSHHNGAQLIDERTDGHADVVTDVAAPVDAITVEHHVHEPEPAPKLSQPLPATPLRNDDDDQPAIVKPSSIAKEKSPSPGTVAGADACRACGKKVYPLEKLVADKNIFHKTCFRCKKCNRTLSSSNYATLNNDYYCKPHQLELFRLQGRYEVSETQFEVVNRSGSEPPVSDGAQAHNESAAEDLRRARAVFENKTEPHSPSPAATQPSVTSAQYGGVGALKSRYLASASQNSESTRPPPRKITPPRHETTVAPKTNTNGSDRQTVEHGEFENEPVRIEGVVRETDRAQFEAEMPKQGSARSALAVFRNLESSAKAGTSVNVSVSNDLKAGTHSPTLESDVAH